MTSTGSRTRCRSRSSRACSTTFRPAHRSSPPAGSSRRCHSRGGEPRGCCTRSASPTCGSTVPKRRCCCGAQTSCWGPTTSSNSPTSPRAGRPASTSPRCRSGPGRPTSGPSRGFLATSRSSRTICGRRSWRGCPRTRSSSWSGRRSWRSSRVPVCDAVLQTTGSARLLASMERLNSFVVALDNRSERYRYHHLFRQLLQNELLRTEPDAVTELSRRAMAWYLANDRPEDAITYGHAARESATVAGLVDRLAFPVCYDGRFATLDEWIGWFDDDQLTRFPALAIYGAWQRTMVGNGDAAERFATLAEGKVSSIPLSDGSPTIEPWVMVFRALTMRRGTERARADADRGLELLARDSIWRPTALNLRGIAHALLGSTDLARADLLAGAQPGSRVRRDRGRLHPAGRARPARREGGRLATGRAAGGRGARDRRRGGPRRVPVLGARRRRRRTGRAPPKPARRAAGGDDQGPSSASHAGRRGPMARRPGVQRSLRTATLRSGRPTPRARSLRRRRRSSIAVLTSARSSATSATSGPAWRR